MVFGSLTPSTNAPIFQVSLSSYSLATSWVERLQGMLDTQLQVLVDQQVQVVLERCGMSKFLGAMKIAPQGVASSTQQGLDEQTAVATMSAFYSQIFSLSVPQYDQIASPDIQTSARYQTAVALNAAHAQVHAMVTDEKNSYANPSAIAVHSPEQVSTLLDIE